MTNAPRYKIEGYITGNRDDDRDARFKVRRNSKAFYINVSPSNFIDSPIMTDKYLSYLEVLRSSEEVLGDIYDTDVYEWVMAPFYPLFTELAPNPLHPIKDITLKEHLFPEFFVFALDIVDEQLHPRRIAVERSPYRPSFVRFDDDFLNDLETWTAFYDPAGIVLSSKNPEDALFNPPNKVLIDNRQIECFFKLCTSSVQIKQELQTYQKILTAGLNSHLNLCNLYGVVMDDSDFILGLLLTYIDNADNPLSTRIHPDEPDEPPLAMRKRRQDQLDVTLTELHKAGIIWGDVKAENVLIDRENNAWMTDFGGGYTEGWVDREMAGTVEGDLMGMAKLKKFIFPSN